ncbi:hypothetical protein D1818_05580 [Aquimarina sp. BL5]|uniref:hypothetical protein n=1 Tax=Aquimarina sp. BL5 TaxID=1714860 RepID=UPI000E4BB8C0|nr:hypothetical protein [Aquimarina sp. BL5]AXT50325.1 hypothetical protein D1818_05580 [Aquimarina sp. BL5]RKM93068.1 hypothetical protein D7036_22475 [Aquimarina sp. BL5]
MNKCIFCLTFLFGFLTFGQQNEIWWNRDLIDSIHTKRLCTDYPGLTKIQSTKEALNESEIVFTGKVVEIIRVEKMEPSDYGEGENGESIPIDFQPIQHYWYIFEPNRVFKGKKKKKIKIYSRIFSTISPLLFIDKEYLIYAIKGEIQESPYIYCNGSSSHIEHAENEIVELEKLTKK